MELHKRRKAITEPEARCFMHQLLLGVKHLLDHRIIHRDLKLANLFLNDNMELKIGDFGLATKLDFDGERKKYEATGVQFWIASVIYILLFTELCAGHLIILHLKFCVRKATVLK